jgi:hypothetical protein
MNLAKETKKGWWICLVVYQMHKVFVWCFFHVVHKPPLFYGVPIECDNALCGLFLGTHLKLALKLVTCNTKLDNWHWNIWDFLTIRITFLFPGKISCQVKKIFLEFYFQFIGLMKCLQWCLVHPPVHQSLEKICSFKL